MFSVIPAASRSRAALRSARIGAIPAARRAESTRLYSSTMHDNDPQTLDAEKAKNLSSQQHGTSTPHPEGAPGWNEHLASASEAAVKADRHAKPAADMQRETIDYIHARHSDDKPSQRGTDASDEVGGPLGAGGGAKETSGGGAKEVIKKKTSVHEETTEVDVDVQTATDSEHFVKADRGEV